MGFFFSAFCLAHCTLVCPWPAARLCLLGLWGLSLTRPWTGLFAWIWAGLALRGEVLVWPAPSGFVCDERFWFLCRSSAAPWLQTALTDSVLSQGANVLRRLVLAACADWGAPWGDLARSLVLGDAAEAGFEQLYRELGLIHVLVISGSQFAFLGKGLELAIQGPLRIAYGLGLLRWPSFAALRLVCESLQLILLFIYLLACGCTPPCQRVFLDIVQRYAGRWWLQPGHRGAHLRTASLQILFFPGTFFSLSNLLSHLAARILKQDRGVPFWSGRLPRALRYQLLNLGIFGRCLPASLLCDLFLTPVWDLLLFLIVLGLWGGWLRSGVEPVLDLLHAGLLRLAQSQTEIWGGSELLWPPDLAHTGSFLCLLVLILSLGTVSRPRSRLVRGGGGQYA